MDLFFKKIGEFINQNEDFSGKLVLTINFDNKLEMKPFISNEFDIDFKKIFLNMKKISSSNLYLDDNYKNKFFDFVFIYNSSLSTRQDSFLEKISSFEKYFKNGTNVFVFYENKQKFFDYFKRCILKKFPNNQFLKRENLNSNKKFYLYDYYYFAYTKNKNLIFLSKLKYILIMILNLFDLQRYFFLSSNILVKYKYMN